MGTTIDIGQARPTVPENDWPDFIESPVFVRYEDGHYLALLEKFSIVGIGESPALAWQQMDEHAISYLGLCEEQGLPYRHVLRPLPLGERLRHRTTLLAIALVRALLKPPHQGERKTEFIHPHTRNGLTPAAC